MLEYHTYERPEMSRHSWQQCPRQRFPGSKISGKIAQMCIMNSAQCWLLFDHFADFEGKKAGHKKECLICHIHRVILSIM